MGKFLIVWLAFSISVMGLLAIRSSIRTEPRQGNFLKYMHFNWGAYHSEILGNGEDAMLVLDQSSGSGVESKRPFLFGSIEMLIKLMPGNSAGTVTAFYLCSSDEKHDEIDFEFLGNETGQPYAIHTNVFTEGGGGREQQFHPWFDPTADYHNYTIHWTPSQIVWYVDSIPIRVYRNYLNDGIPYPNKQPMRVYASIWNADSWATQRGLVKIDWANAPFVARLRNFRTRPVSQNHIASDPSAVPSDYNNNTQLTRAQQRQMRLVRNKYKDYDYCKDTKRFRGLFPGECFKAQY